MTTQRVRGGRARAEAIELLAAREPATTWALGATTSTGRRRSIVWLVRDGDRVGGVLVAIRYCFDRWTGICLLDDPGCADEMARLVDRSSLWSVTGPSEALDAVLPSTKRSRGTGQVWLCSLPMELAAEFGGNAPSRPWGDDVSVRLASPADLNALVALYSSANALRVPTRRLRGAARQSLSQTLVAESDGVVRGAVLTAAGNRYIAFNRLIVSPDLRGRDVGFALVVGASLFAFEQGKGSCGFRATRTGVRALARGLGLSQDRMYEAGDAVRWTIAGLHPPRRFRGQHRLRTALELLEELSFRLLHGQSLRGRSLRIRR